MLPGKKRKIAIAIGSLVGASAIIAGVTIPIVLKNKNDDTSKIVLSDFKKLETKFDKIEKQLNIKQTSDFNLSTSSGQKIIKDHVFSLISFTKKEKEAIFLITKKGIITSKNRLEVVFEIKIDDQKKEYQFQVRHFSSDDEFKLYDLKQKINRYDLEEVIVIDQTKTFNQNLIKQTIINEINKVNTKKLSTDEKNALSLNNNISLSGIEEKNVVVIITFGKEIAAYTFIISLQEPTDESNFLKLKNKFDSINLEQTISRTLDLDLSDSYNQEFVKNFLFSLKNFTKKEKASVLIVTNNATISSANFTNVEVKISIGSKKENAKTYTFKLKRSLDINEANFINLKNKFNKIDISKAITLPILQTIDLTNENDRKILLNKIIDYVDNLNSNNWLNQLEKNALSIETKSGFISYDKVTNVIVKITLGNENKSYPFKILKLKNQDEFNFNSLKAKFDKFKIHNDKNPILWKKEDDNINFLYRQRFYNVLFRSIDEQNANNLLTPNEKKGIEIDFFSRGGDDDENDFRFVFPRISISKFGVDISFGKFKKSYRLRIKREPFTESIDQKGIDDFYAKIIKATSWRGGGDDDSINLIEIDHPYDIPLNNISFHDYLRQQIINHINSKNLNNPLNKKEKSAITNIFYISANESINFYKETVVNMQIFFNIFYEDEQNSSIYLRIIRKPNNQLIFNNLKNKFDQSINKEIILKNESQDLLLSNPKIKAAVIDKINAINPDNLIKNKEKQYIIIKDDSSEINYKDWTNVIVEVKVDSFKKEYTFKIKREKHNNDFKKQFDALNEKMKKVRGDKLKVKEFNIRKSADPNRYIAIASSTFRKRIYEKIDSLLETNEKITQEEKNTFKFFNDSGWDHLYFPNDNPAKSRLKLRIGIRFGQYFEIFNFEIIYKR